MLGRNQFCKMTVMERFESYIFPEPNTGCWLWLGTCTGSPFKYAMFWNGEKVVKAHRWIFEQIKGPIPTNMVIDHQCRMTTCVNPNHLRVVSQRENILCGLAPAALQHRQTHCIHGHELNDANTYRGPTGRRQCKPCRRLTDRKRKCLHQKQVTL